MGGEGVTQPVRVRKQPSGRAGVQAPAPGGEEQRVFGSAGQLGACLPKVARHPVTGLLAERDVALLAALALNMDELLLEVHVAQIEIHKLTASQAGRIHELGHSTVAQPERTVSLEPRELRVDFLGLWSLRQPPRTARRERGLGHALWTEGEPNQRPHSGELSCDRRRGEFRTAAPEVGGVIRQRANVDIVEAKSTAFKPGTELPQVDSVSALRRC